MAANPFCFQDEEACESAEREEEVWSSLPATISLKKPGARSRAKSRRWRSGVHISVIAHILVVGLFYVGSDKLVRLPDLTGPSSGVASDAKSEDSPCISLTSWGLRPLRSELGPFSWV